MSHPDSKLEAAEALAALSSQRRPIIPISLFSSFTSSSIIISPDRSNKFDLHCPRPGCASLILKAGVGEYVEGDSIQLDPESHTPPLPLEPLPESSTIQWWLIKPNPMQFENIAFSKSVVPTTDEKPKKYLACAECDLGPLGWCEEGGTEFWIAVSRVGYRVQN